jgi:hypothetical protein
MLMKTMTKLTIVALATVFGLNLAALAEDDDDAKPAKPAASASQLPPAATNSSVIYATDIKPILDASCVDCHSGNRAKGGLHLDSLAGAVKGSKDGKVITVGDSAKSLLVQSVAHVSKDSDDWMPPLKNRAGIKPLTPEQIGLIRAWIDQGAK